jgi:hypothetical protein
MLPKIDNGRHPLPARTRSGPGRLGRPPTNGYNPDIRHQETIHVSEQDFQPGITPLTLELQHGNQKHAVCLPTDNLDKSKKYYVTFTINKSAPIEQKQMENTPTTVEPQQMRNSSTRNDKMDAKETKVSRDNVPPETDVSQDPCRIFNRINVHKNTLNATTDDTEFPTKQLPADLRQNPLKIFDRVRVQPTPIILPTPDKK